MVGRVGEVVFYSRISFLVFVWVEIILLFSVGFGGERFFSNVVEIILGKRIR